MDLNINLVNFVLSSFLGLTINFWYGFLKHEWAASDHQRYVSIILPPAILIMTWVIASNLALSLGMIGALSIVRFRNPVKSPFELAIYFVFIVIGVSSGVDYKYALLIWALAMLAPLIVKIMNSINNLLNVKDENNTGGYIVHMKLDCEIEKLIEVLNAHDKSIFSIGRDASDNKISLSLMIDDTQEYSNIKTYIKKCAKIISEDIQKSF